MNAPFIHPKSDCRRYARQFLRENPNLSFDEILESYEIKEEACKGTTYDRTDLLNWILPDLTPHEELPHFFDLPQWRIEEAAALWLDLNPLLFLLASKRANPEALIGGYHPNVRARYSQLLDKAISFAISGQLPVKEFKGDYWVTPRDFYEWAIKTTTPPDGSRMENFFEKLREAWSSDGNSKETKVEVKIKEIRRILESLKTADPAFDPTAMPGRKKDFHDFCIQMNRLMFSIASATFNDYLAGVCRFNPGARATDYYTNIAPKLG